MNLNFLLCILNDGPHCAGEGVLAFLCKTTKEATPFRLVCKEFTRAIACFPWKCCTKIKHRFSRWQTCFPNAFHCFIYSAYVTKADLHFFKHVTQFNLKSSFDFVASHSFPYLNRVRYLELFNGEFSRDQELDAIKIIAAHCVILEKLIIYDCTDAMLDVLQQCPNLTEIWFGTDDGDSDDDTDDETDDGDTDNETDDEFLDDFEDVEDDEDEDEDEDDAHDKLYFSAEGLAQFGQAKKILKMTNTMLTDEVCVAIAANFPALTDFSAVVEDDLFESSLVRIVEKCQHLTHVWFSLSISTDALLVALSQHPSIQEIILPDTRLTDKGVFALLQCKTLLNFKCEEKRCELSATCKEAVLKRFPLCFN